MLAHIEIMELPEGGFTIIVNERFEELLSRGEALEVVAAVLFGASRVPYIHTYEEWDAHQMRYYAEEYQHPVAEIEDKRVLAKANTRLWPKEFLKLRLAK